MPAGRTGFVVAGALAALIVAGCGSQQFSPVGRELMKPLQTAVSAENSEWLDATEEKIIARNDAGELSEPEFRALETVIEQARSGDWEGANRAIIALIDAQRSTAEDVADLQKGKRSRSREKGDEVRRREDRR